MLFCISVPYSLQGKFRLRAFQEAGVGLAFFLGDEIEIAEERYFWFGGCTVSGISASGNNYLKKPL